jgi:hypothetical protein
MHGGRGAPQRSARTVPAPVIWLKTERVLRHPLDCVRLLRYVIIDKTIEFSGQSPLFVDGRELGDVPCLAICEEKKTGGVLLFPLHKRLDRLGLFGTQVSR